MPKPSLQSQFLALCSQIGLNGEDQWTKIHTSYTTSGLAYHNLDHIADCLEKFSTRKDEAEDPISVELAIWFHDVIYDPKASDNEEQSARQALDFLASTPCAQIVSDLILATKHSGEPITPDKKLLCDIDLSILGSDSSRYQEYSEAIRDEYSFVPEAKYQTGRTNVLQQFLNRPSIFSLGISQDLYESQARQNLTKEILSLQAEN